jgi:hypothetical protein
MAACYGPLFCRNLVAHFGCKHGLLAVTPLVFERLVPILLCPLPLLFVLCVVRTGSCRHANIFPHPSPLQNFCSLTMEDEAPYENNNNMGKSTGSKAVRCSWQPLSHRIRRIFEESILWE